MNELQNALHNWADHTPSGRPPVAELIAAGRKRRIRTRMASGGIAAVALAAGISVSLTATAAPSTEPAAPQAQNQTPAMELAAAATSTSGSTFRFRIDSTLTLVEWQINKVTTTCTGAVDPAKGAGILKSSPMEARLVDGRHYISKGPGNWAEVGKGTLESFMRCGDDNVPSVAAADPNTVLKVLRKAAAVTKVAGGYKFTDESFSGTVTVTEGKISTFAYDVDQKRTSDYPAYTKHVVMKLSDHGVPVSVRKPI